VVFSSAIFAWHPCVNNTGKQTDHVWKMWEHRPTSWANYTYT